jgi:predicted RNA-binding protein with TRAM domain
MPTGYETTGLGDVAIAIEEPAQEGGDERCGERGDDVAVPLGFVVLVPQARTNAKALQ